MTRSNRPKIGTPFGLWTVAGLPISSPQTHQILVPCTCSCGMSSIVLLGNLRSGKSSKCRVCAYKLRIKNDVVPGWYWACIRASARARKYEFMATRERTSETFLAQNRRCVLTGVPLNFGTQNTRNTTTASLDRIDSAIGYVDGNVRWVHKIINIMRGSMSDQEFLRWCSLAAHGHAV